MTIKKLKITVNNQVYNVTVEVEGEEANMQTAYQRPSVPLSIQSTVPKIPIIQTVEAGVVVAPLAGIIVNLEVNVGDEVTSNTKVLTLEAMKMQTAIYAGCAGKISDIYVKRGDAVTENALLLKIC